METACSSKVYCTLYIVFLNFNIGFVFTQVSALAQKPACSNRKMYTKKLKVQFRVQAWQFRKIHVDRHYNSAPNRYEKEFGVKFRQYTTFVSQDNKHKIKVGGPEYPVAEVDQGRAVLVGLNEKKVVQDHEFTKFTLTPSVNFLIDIPETMDSSLYFGKVFVGFKLL